jgi:type II secretory pathway pseudopilin PulG
MNFKCLKIKKLKHSIKIENFKLKINPQGGFSTLELLISISVIITALTAVILVVFSNQTVSLDNQLNDEALIKANSLMEQAKGSASYDFSALKNAATVTDDIFKKELMVSDINPCKKTGVASVSWQTEPGRLLQIQLQTTFTNPTEAIALGGDCGPDNPPATEWWFPTSFDDTFDLKDFGAPNSGVMATGVDVISKNGSKYMLLSTRHSTTSVQDIWIFNVDDTANPVLMSAINTGTTGPGLNDVDGISGFTFVANHESTKQLQSIDITNLSGPDVAASVSLPGIGNSYPQGQEVFYYNDRIYVGTWETAGNEFQVFDISNPSSPVLLGNKQINHSIRKIFVKNQLVNGVNKTIAYLAVSASTISNNPELIAIDVTDPADSTTWLNQIGSYNPPGDRDGSAVYVIGNNLYLGRVSASSTEHNFFILDISDPASIGLLGSKFASRNPSQGLEITALVVSGDFAFLATDDSNAEFQVFKISNPSAITNCNETPPAGYSFPPEGCGKYNFPAKITDLDYHDDFIYASIESNAAFRIIYDDTSQY